MAVTVYADVLVIVNLYVDFFLLWATRRVLQLRAKPWRLAAGALEGGLCALACLLPQPWWASLLWGGVSAAAVTAAAVCPLSRRGFLKSALCFWVFSLGLAGLCRFLIQWAGAPSLAVVGSGLSYPRQFAGQLAAGALEQGCFQLAGFGRMAFAYPSFAKDMLSGKGLDPKQCCVACGKCSQLMRLGSMAGCEVRDSVYTALYREAQQKATS